MLDLIETSMLARRASQCLGKDGLRIGHSLAVRASRRWTFRITRENLQQRHVGRLRHKALASIMKTGYDQLSHHRLLNGVKS